MIESHSDVEKERREVRGGRMEFLLLESFSSIVFGLSSFVDEQSRGWMM